MKNYMVLANDGGANGCGVVSEFSVISNKDAKAIFEKKFKKNKKFNPDGLDLYWLPKNEPDRRIMIDTRWRLVTAPGSHPKSKKAILKAKKLFWAY